MNKQLKAIWILGAVVIVFLFNIIFGGIASAQEGQSEEILKRVRVQPQFCITSDCSDYHHSLATYVYIVSDDTSEVVSSTTPNEFGTYDFTLRRHVFPPAVFHIRVLYGCGKVHKETVTWYAFDAFFNIEIHDKGVADCENIYLPNITR